MEILTVDYSNAFPTLSHNFIRAVLVFIQLPHGFMGLVLSSLFSCFYFLVGNSVNNSHIFQPKAGIFHGDTISPPVCSFCSSFVIFPLNHTPGGVEIYLYVDGLLVTASHKCMGKVVAYVMQHLNRFSAISGLHINLSMSAFVLKG